MYVVLDSNIWRKELGLKSGLGSATRLFIQQNSATLIIPEVVRLETEKNIRSALGDYIKNIEDNYSQLLTLFGNLKEISLPSDSEVDKVVKNIFDNLEVSIEVLPFSIDSARSSFNKIIEKLPPSDRDQQFKDGVIWADCMKLLEKDDVHFVTLDRAFYKGRNYDQGLAKNLRIEANEKDHDFVIHSDLTELLDSIRTDIVIDPKDLLKHFLKKHNQSIQAMLDRFSFSYGELSSHTISVYSTTSPSSLYVEFELKIKCSSTEDNGRSQEQLILKGDGKYDPSSGNFKELRRLGEEIKFINADGKEESRKSAIINIGPMVLGHRDEKHEIISKLD